MPILLIFDAFALLICEKNVANCTLLRCKTFSLKIWVCKIFDKFHVCGLFLLTKNAVSEKGQKNSVTGLLHPFWAMSERKHFFSGTLP